MNIAPVTPPIISLPHTSPTGRHPTNPVNNAMVDAHNTQAPLKAAPAIPGIENNGVDAEAVNKKLANLQLASAARNVDNKSEPSSPMEPKAKNPTANPLREQAISGESVETGEIDGMSIPGITSHTAEKTALAEASDTVDQAVLDIPDTAKGLDESAAQ